MKFEVPQFIEIEDKIIGPLTWRQFVYLAGGLGALIILYFIFPFMVFVMIGLPIGALAGSLAFHRVNNRPFSIFLESFVNYFTKKKLYIWRKNEAQIITASDTRSATPIVAPVGNSLRNLAQSLDIHSPNPQ